MAVEALRPANSANLVVFTFLANLFAEKYNWFAESGLPVSVQFNFYLTCFLFDPIYSFHLISCHLSYFLHQSRPPHLLRLSSTPHIGPLLIFSLILPLIFLLVFLSVFFLYTFPLMVKMGNWKGYDKERNSCRFLKKKESPTSLEELFLLFLPISSLLPSQYSTKILPKNIWRCSIHVAFKYLKELYSITKQAIMLLG